VSEAPTATPYFQQTVGSGASHGFDQGGMSKKPKKTPRQLADMIADRMRIGDGSMIVIHPNRRLGWRASIMAAPNMAVRAQQTVDQIASELRAQFDLED